MMHHILIYLLQYIYCHTLKREKISHTAYYRYTYVSVHIYMYFAHEKKSCSLRRIYAIWATFCCAVPCIMVFGTPLLMTILARPFPQEVLAALTLLTSAFVFSNTLYMSLFAGFGLCRLRAQSLLDPKHFGVEGKKDRRLSPEAVQRLGRKGPCKRCSAAISVRVELRK